MASAVARTHLEVLDLLTTIALEVVRMMA